MTSDQLHFGILKTHYVPMIVHYGISAIVQFLAKRIQLLSDNTLNWKDHSGQL